MQHNRHKEQGMTLIELMIVIVIISVLASVALPSWNAMVQKSRRSDAVNILLLAQVEQEKYRANNTSYASSMSDLGLSTYDSSAREHYQVTVQSASATAYLITAAPNGAQAGDTECGTFAIRQTGPEHSGYAALSCW